MTTPAQTLPAHTRPQKPPPPSPSPTDDQVKLPSKEAERMPRPRSKKVDRQSPEYLVKSGVAGGLAGCAVRGGVVFTITAENPC